MEKLNVWSRQINEKIKENADQLYRTDYKFYKLDRLEKITVKIDEFSSTCEECQKLKTDIETLVETIHLLANGSPSDRKIFEKNNESYMKHLSENHGLVQETYYLSKYTLLGILVGTLIIGGISYIINPLYAKLGILIGFAVGLTIGRVYGKKLDKAKKLEGLVL
jgi:hypothetical protein